MSKELEALQIIIQNKGLNGIKEPVEIIETALKEYENLKEENKMLRENNENLDENYFDTWCACEILKENSNYALMFLDDIYCLVDTKDNKFDVIDNYEINNYGIIDNGTKKKLKAFEIIKEKDIDLFEIKHCKTLDDYKICVTLCDYPVGEEDIPTQEEFDFLKEVLK